MIDETVPERLFPTFDLIESVIWPWFALLVFVLTAVLVDVMILLATRWRMLDLPSRRSAHSLPTARGGGMPMVLACAIASTLVCVRWPFTTIPVLAGIVIPSLIIALVGFVDDIRPLRAVLRLLIQIGVAAMVVAVLGPLREIRVPGLPPLALGWLAWPISLLWVVGMTNAFNFMDGSDGMAALSAVVASLAFVAFAFMTNDMATVLLAAFVGAAAGGFMVFNWSPARVFMGDVGSAFLGTFFAALALFAAGRGTEQCFIPMVLALWPSIYDPFLSVIRRVWNGHNPLVPHREFLFHRLIRSGVGHAATALLYAALALAGGAIGLLMLWGEIPEEARRLLPLAAVVMAVALTAGVERRCRITGLDRDAAARRTRQIVEPAGAR